MNGPSPILPGHGTYAGAQRHRKAGGYACDDCLEGERFYKQQWRARRKVPVSPRYPWVDSVGNALAAAFREGA